MSRRDTTPRLGGNCAPWVIARLTGRTVDDCVAEVLVRRHHYHAPYRRRKVGGGTPQRLTEIMLREAGVDLKPIELPVGTHDWYQRRDRYGYVQDVLRRSGYTTVAKFIKAHPVGTFLVRISGHVMLVEDGELIDNQRPNGAEPTRYRYARSRVVSADRVDSRRLGEHLRDRLKKDLDTIGD